MTTMRNFEVVSHNMQGTLSVYCLTPTLHGARRRQNLLLNSSTRYSYTPVGLLDEIYVLLPNVCILHLEFLSTSCVLTQQ